MLKKGLLLLAVLFLISGCTVNYDLVIDNDSISEDVSIKIPMSEIDLDKYENQINYPMKVYGGEEYNYDKQTSEDVSNHFVNYKYKHDIDKYYKSLFIGMCYDDKKILVSDDKISISTSNVFKCIAMDDGYRAKKVDVNITTKLKVLENNADEIKGNTYIWHMNEYEYSNKPIKLLLKKDQSVLEQANNINNANNIGMITIILFLVVVGLLVYIVMTIKHKKNSNF